MEETASLAHKIRTAKLIEGRRGIRLTYIRRIQI
jgi:hypothetical protein